ncbi:hypothetical protein TWF730_006308 [Orbilia blumenaviensis]|uniref:Peptidase C14 caspase domain-containing protein n=1 Tax=Orbilia blumenaviensis TaxID=1796055 RepID=A0AAV9VDX8_9PEZI
MEANSEPIYHLSNSCKEIFAKYASKDPPSAIDILFLEYEQRFLAWSAYMGVFADKSISLDRRLRDRSDISDLVIRLLDVLSDSLAQIISNCDKLPLNENSLIGLDDEPSIEDDDISMLEPDKEVLEIIEVSLTRLSRLGNMIRQSSDTSRVARIRDLAEKLDLTPFERRARVALNILYPDSNEGLRAQLTRSMVDSYASILYTRTHQQKLNTPRTSQIPRFQAIFRGRDDTIAAQSGVDFSDITESLPGSSSKPSPNLKPNHHFMNLRATPSTVRSIPKSSLQRMLFIPHKPESRYSASSVQRGKVTYPPPPKERDAFNFLTCEWCLQRHPHTLFECNKSWSAHLDKDFKPYVCISERCMDKGTLPRYESFKRWLHHMNTFHTPKWQQEVHKPISWTCNFKHPIRYFSTVELLHNHMINCYPEDLATELEAIARNSYIKRSRSPEICPLCCRDLIHEKRQKKHAQTGSHKRLKLRNNRNEEAMHAGATVPDNLVEESEHLDSEEEHSEPPEILMARHIASHLQMSMFLTIRLIECQSEEEASTETETSYLFSAGDSSDIGSTRAWSSQMSEEENDGSFNNLPYPINPNFKERKDFTTEIHTILWQNNFPRDSLAHRPSRRAVTLYGTTGSGKTQIALHYAHEYAKEYPATFWVDATNESQLASSARSAVQSIIDNYTKEPSSETCRNVAYSLGLSFDNLDITSKQSLIDLVDRQSPVKCFRNWLCQEFNDRWLLIIDGYNDQVVYDISALLPTQDVGHILITSRNVRQDLGTQNIEVPEANINAWKDEKNKRAYNQRETWALLIGIDHYIPGRNRKMDFNFSDLGGCVNDVRAVKGYLQKINVKHIAMLTSTRGADGPEEEESRLPNSPNIIRELERIMDDSKPGDLVYIHYSGHGIRKAHTAIGYGR